MISFASVVMVLASRGALFLRSESRLPVTANLKTLRITESEISIGSVSGGMNGVGDFF